MLDNGTEDNHNIKTTACLKLNEFFTTFPAHFMNIIILLPAIKQLRKRYHKTKLLMFSSAVNIYSIAILKSHKIVFIDDY